MRDEQSRPLTGLEVERERLSAGCRRGFLMNTEIIHAGRDASDGYNSDVSQTVSMGGTSAR